MALTPRNGQELPYTARLRHRPRRVQVPLEGTGPVHWERQGLVPPSRAQKSAVAAPQPHDFPVLLALCRLT